MPTGSWRARSMLASSYCCPEKPFVLKIRPFVLKIQPFGKSPLAQVGRGRPILHRVMCTRPLDKLEPTVLSGAQSCGR